jgi:hypothetical protein
VRGCSFHALTNASINRWIVSSKPDQESEEDEGRIMICLFGNVISGDLRKTQEFLLKYF